MCSKESELLQGINEFIYKLYFHAIRRYVDYATRVVGIKRGISWQSLAEEMYIEPRPGDKGGAPHKSKLRRGVQQLEKIGLIINLSKGKRLIFELPYITSDKSARKKADIDPTHQADIEADTLQVPFSPMNAGLHINALKKADTEADIGENAKADTPHIVIYKQSTNVDCNPPKKGNKRLCPSDFQVMDHHRELAIKNGWPNPDDEIEAFKDWHIGKGSKQLDWDRTFYTWLRNAKRFTQGGGNARSTQTNANQTRQQNSVDRAIANILNTRR